MTETTSTTVTLVSTLVELALPALLPELENIEEETHENNNRAIKGLHLRKNLALHATSFTAWTVAVAVITAVIVKKYMSTSSDAADDFFLGGRSLVWHVIAGSLMLTNLSTCQLVGLNGTIFRDGCMAGIAWESFAALAMCITATVFLPTYASSSFSTTSGFLGERFDRTVRTLVSVIFLVYYTMVTCPMVLYTGGLAVRTIFDLHEVPLWVISTLIGIIGSIYALSGGLKAVAISDCLNGIGLIVFGIWVPIAALRQIGGFSALFQEDVVGWLKPFATTSMIWDNELQKRTEGQVSVPWSVLVTGMMIPQVYYWSTNQVIVQRVLGAKSLAHGQKGVMFAATMKIIGFMFLCLPGVVGMLMMHRGVLVNGKPFSVPKSDEVYPLVVKAAMPSWSLGLFAAVLLGSVLSTFNSALQSASTLFCLEIYSVFVEPGADAERQKTVATIFGVALSIFSYFVAPQLAALGSIFEYIQKINAMFSLPIVSLFCVGMATRLPDAFAAKTGFVVGVITYGSCQFVKDPNAPHWLHMFAICFALAIFAMMMATTFPGFRRLFMQEPVPAPYVQKKGGNMVDITPWGALYPYCGAVTGLVALISVALQVGSQALFYLFWILWMAAMLVMMFVLRAETSGPLGKELSCDPDHFDSEHAEHVDSSSTDDSEDSTDK